jgi:hypothetical protein
MVAVTIEGRILEALVGHLNTLPGGRRVVWSNVQYPKNGEYKDDEYIVVGFSPGTPETVTITATEQNRHMGIFSLAVMCPLNVGEMYPQEMGGTIASHFQAKVLTSGSTRVRITARPRVAGGYVDGDRWRTPVTVPFETISV